MTLRQKENDFGLCSTCCIAIIPTGSHPMAEIYLSLEEETEKKSTAPYHEHCDWVTDSVTVTHL